MFRYLFWRVLGLIGELILISVITFAISRAVPGGPYDEGEIPFTADQKAAFMKRYGLDRPLHEQYLTYVWNALHLDFGISFQSPSDTVMQLIARTWPVSIQLGSMALAIGFAAGLGLGIIAALRQNTWVDYLATLVSAITIAVPNFVVGILLIIVFGVILKWLPTGGWDSPKHWILPVFAYALYPLGTVARYTRSSMLDAIRSDYVRTARAKGLSERAIALRHVLKNAMIPLLTIMLPMIPAMLTGTIFIESMFRIPGLGVWFVTSSFRRDYPMIMGTVLLWAVLITLTYLVTDVLYVIVDPRVRLDEKTRI
jgi:ABC-type dipeptide/oligopeptide/nickel transport system permease component